MEFKPFSKINHLRNTRMQITQKIHGTNAQVMIIPREDRIDYDHGFDGLKKELDVVDVDGQLYEVRAGSRTRWIYPGDDNFAFAKFVYENREALVRALGPGQHFGEWAGLGINSGEGLMRKVFCLFDYWRYADVQLPEGVTTVPVLYEGSFDLAKIHEVMADLKATGSKLSPGFMRPEGVVVNALGTRLKFVFEAEETKWTKGDQNAKEQKEREKDTSFELVAHLLQPIRLEKLLSRDETYLVQYPKSLPNICKDYIKDLEEEGQIVGDESQISSTKKVLGKHLFGFVKAHVPLQS
jgi:hypothetical protein